MRGRAVFVVGREAGRGVLIVGIRRGQFPHNPSPSGSPYCTTRTPRAHPRQVAYRFSRLESVPIDSVPITTPVSSFSIVPWSVRLSEQVFALFSLERAKVIFNLFFNSQEPTGTPVACSLDLQPLFTHCLTLVERTPGSTLRTRSIPHTHYAHHSNKLPRISSQRNTPTRISQRERAHNGSRGRAAV